MNANNMNASIQSRHKCIKITCKMTSTVWLSTGGTFHRTLMFMLKLGWKSRYRLPVLIIVAFVALDISMQLEIALEHENGTEHHAHL
uniref:Uncharacterized protein n=1 Tax=Vespula pensylvanica TaxID=30213 RepID=A0A834P8S3_VESPE|nr:hypothetical protein H0235_005245 [Vespula pensylvanica]